MRIADLHDRNQSSREALAYSREWFQLPIKEIRTTLPFVVKTSRQDADPRIRLSASALLGLLSTFRPNDVLEIVEGYEPAILEGFTDPEGQIRSNFIRCLAFAQPSPPTEATEHFKRALADDRAEARAFAVVGLVRADGDSLDSAEAIVDLLDVLSDADRPSVIRALGAARATHPVVIAKLVEQLDSHDPLVLESSTTVLGSIGPPAVQAAEKLRGIIARQGVDDTLRQRAINALDFVEGRRGVLP